MDHGPPDAKRTRMGSWSDGHQPHQSHRDLPPLYAQPPPFLQPTSQGPPHHLDERRHHEAEFASPSQDPHRIHSVSGQPFNAFGGGRETIVKRDHSAEPTVQIQHPRPLSTGEIMENHVNPPPPEDPRRQSIPSYDHPMNQSYRPAPVYPQPPQNPPYDRQGYDPPPTPGGFRDQIHSQACEACRAAKAKCDDPKPCTSCREKGIKCDWKPPEPKQTDKVQAEMNDTLRQIKHETNLLLQKVDNVEKKLTQKTRKLAKITSALLKLNPDLQAELSSEDEKEKEVKEEDEPYQGFRRPSALPRGPSTPDHHHAYQPCLAFRAESPDIQPMQEDEEEDGDGKLVIPSESTIPVGHTTGAAKLLLWPAIDNLVGERLREDKIKNEYPYIQEKRHGLRLFGRGPGGSPAHVFDATSEDTYSDVSASPAADTLVHGQIGGITPPPGVDVIRGPEQRRGGLNQEGHLELDEATVRRLVQSYLKHIHIMHPILDPNQLERLVKNFLRGLQEPTPKPKITSSMFAVPGQAEHLGSKRKRSPATETVIENGVTYLLKPGQPQRSIFTAILFMVLALGKICEHKEKIPDVIPDYESSSSPSAFRNGYMSPIQASPIMSPHSSGFPSPQDGPPRGSGRRSSGDGMATVNRFVPSLRNLDVIPGLAYACIATDILGNELGENSLHHVHANVLASLYFGQLARPVRSHGFISNASRTLQIILRLKLDRLKRYRTVPEDTVRLENVPAKDNPLIFAFWTCLQLESDIVAELDLPHSGILTLEPVMPYPNLSLAKETNTMTPEEATSYQAQLWMRSHLNEIHRKLYTAGMEETYKLPIANAIDRFPIIEELARIISERGMIPPTMRWAENDPPPNDILAARLRAKFHGAEVITYRPFLKMVLNRPSALSPDAPPEDISPKIMNYSRLCIRAMVDSTRAFHGMGEDRLIVTNVWGTAHAQWGNVIVLQAAFQDSILRPYIDETLLKILVRKTLKFLKNVADRASALMTDIRILEYVAVKTGILEVQELNSSFSSIRTGSADTPFH